MSVSTASECSTATLPEDMEVPAPARDPAPKPTMEDLHRELTTQVGDTLPAQRLSMDTSSTTTSPQPHPTPGLMPAQAPGPTSTTSHSAAKSSPPTCAQLQVLVEAAIAGDKAGDQALRDAFPTLDPRSRLAVVDHLRQELEQQVKAQSSSTPILRVTALLATCDVAEALQILNPLRSLLRVKEMDAIEKAIAAERKKQGRVQRANASPCDSRFENRLDGLYRIFTKTKNSSNGTQQDEEVDQRLGPSLSVIARARSGDKQEWAYLLRFTDPDGTEHNRIIRSTEFRTEELFTILASEGYEFSETKESAYLLRQYVMSVNPKDRLTTISQPGWVGDTYVVGDRENTAINPTGTETYRIHPAPRIMTSTRAGTLDEWRSEVSIACRGNSRLLFGISCSCAGALLRRIGGESTIYNLLGDSGCGKNTVQIAAASVWGTWSSSPGKIYAWRATDNGMEGFAALHNDGCMILEEVAQITPSSAVSIAYMIGNGTGKLRKHSDCSMQAVSASATICLSSGEISFGTVAERHGSVFDAGAKLRCPDIPGDAGAGMGIFDQIPVSYGLDLVERGKQYAVAIADAASRRYGMAGPAFVERLARMPITDVRAYYQNIEAAFIARFVPPGSHRQVARVASRFAMVAAAGEMATWWGITGWAPDEALAAVGVCFTAWLINRGNGSSEEDTYVKTVKTYLERYGEAHFPLLGACHNGLDLAGLDRHSERAGYRKEVNGQMRYMILCSIFETKICKGLNHKSVAKVLHKGGHLIGVTNKPPEYGVPIKIKGIGQARYIIVCETILNA
ncbi:MAG: DUF927 domain-containing protein [Planctomycetes bacterium]|nr:DUF927 domain-containing protein [Planctomycetota bacterium]